MPDELARRSSAALTSLLMLAIAAQIQIALAQSRPVPDTFTAVTTAMEPAGVTLRVDVLHWSDDAGRAAVTAALADGSNTPAALAELATLGYVWTSGSGVGYALKYAHREPAEDGGERVTLVTDRALGAYSFQTWSANDGSSGSEHPYSVIELYLDADGRGVGSLSLAAEVNVDGERQAVGLGGDARVLTEARREPKPYWGQGS